MKFTFKLVITTIVIVYIRNSSDGCYIYILLTKMSLLQGRRQEFSQVNIMCKYWWKKRERERDRERGGGGGMKWKYFGTLVELI